MYGVPADLDLRGLIGSTLVQIALGEFQIQFHFTPDTEIAVEGRWEVRDGAGRLIDNGQENANREVYRVHHLLGRHVVHAEVDPPDSMTLKFDNGYSLQIFDSKKDFESFTIQPGGIVV